MLIDMAHAAADMHQPVTVVRSARSLIETLRSRRREGEDRFRLATEAVDGLVYDVDMRSGTVFRSRGLTRLLGYDPDDIPGTAGWWLEQIHPDDRDDLLASAKDSQSLTSSTSRYRVRHRDGRWIHVEDRAVLLQDADGAPVRMVGCTRDITADIEAAAERQHREQFLARVLHASPGVVYLFDVSKNATVFINERVQSALGITPAEVTAAGARFMESRILPEDRPTLMRHVSGMMAKQDDEVGTTEYRMLRTDGTPVWFSSRDVVFARDASGDVQQVLGVAIDIDAHKRTEADLRRTVELNHSLLASSSDGIIVIAADGALRDINPAGRQAFGLAPDAPLAGLTWQALWAGTAGSEPDDAFERARRGTATTFHSHGQHTGTRRWWDIALSPIHAGTPAALHDVLAIARDVTLQHTAAEHERSEWARVRQIIDSMFAFVGMLTLDGRLVEVNSAPLAVLHARREDVLGQFFWDCPWWNYDVAVQERLRSAFATACTGQEVRYEETICTAGNGRMVIDFLLHPVMTDGAVRFVIPSGVDISERKLVEERLRDSEARFRMALRSSDLIVYAMDNDLRYTWVHNSHPALQGGDVIGRRDEDLLPPDAAAVLTALKRRVLTTGAGLREEVSVPLSDATHCYDVAIEPVTNADGTVTGLTAVALDVTRRKESEAELRRLANDLAVMDRRKDEFLATLAHELRNPLAPLRNGIELLRLSQVPAPVEQIRQMMDRQLAQLVRLVDDLFDVSRITHGKVQLLRRPIDLRDVVAAAVEMSTHVLSASEHHVTLQIAPHPVVVSGDASRLTQVLSNLLSNSAKYTPRGGTITIRLTADRDQALLSVRDTGIGIPVDMLERVFEMFAQVDRVSDAGASGLGIGLALVRGLIELHGGTISAHSEGPGTGSLFSIALPLMHAAVAPGTGEAPGYDPGAAAAGGWRILVIDDNVDAADSLAQVLRQYGCVVQQCYDGASGVASLESFVPDVILCDLGMPGLDGFEVAARVRARRNGTVVLIATTGWGQEHDRSRTADAGFDHHLVKPVDVTRLLQLVREQPHPKT